MQIISHTVNQKQIAEIVSMQIIITDTEAGLTLLLDLYYKQFHKIILYEHQLTPQFFDLKTGVAGELLQKFSNYRMQLAVVGWFKTHNSNSIKSFMVESNKGGNIMFVPTLADALQ